LATALTAVGLSAPPAMAAEVSVAENPGDPNTAVLTFTASPGENNHLTIHSLSRETEFLHLEVLDTGAAVTPGPGCSGGGSLAAPVACQMHVPRETEQKLDRKVVLPVPGTGWSDSMSIRLGDGDNFFDGSSFTGLYSESVSMDVTSGDGRDQILTGGGHDEIDPGAGADTVRSGEAIDRVEATPRPDGPDLYDLGGDGNVVSYEKRTTPVLVNGTSGGAPGEDDTILGIDELFGGSAGDTVSGEFGYIDGGPGDDRLTISPRSNPRGYHTLRGGPGNDFLSAGDGHGGGYNSVHGGLGDDVIHGRGGEDFLYGAAGDDVVYGEGGRDLVEAGAGEDVSYGGAGPDSFFETGEGGEPISYAAGKDVVHGGPGNDFAEEDLGPDLLYGGSGNDQLGGGPGADTLIGGGGNDFLVGDTGFDRLFGEEGSDRLVSGRFRPGQDSGFYTGAPDDGRDLDDCGPGRDSVTANPWDPHKQCETARTVRPPRP